MVIILGLITMQQYVCNMITFESLDVESLFVVCRYIFRVYGSSSVRLIN